MFEVLEHVDQPMVMIKRVTDLLELGGILYLTTPNYNSLDRLVLGEQWDVFHPEHITYFSTRGLVRLIQRLEPRLQIVSVESNNVSPQLVGRALSLLNELCLVRMTEGRQLTSRETDTSFDMRHFSEASRYSRGFKQVINKVLSVFGLGSTTIVTAKKFRS